MLHLCRLACDVNRGLEGSSPEKKRSRLWLIDCVNQLAVGLMADPSNQLADQLAATAGWWLR